MAAAVSPSTALRRRWRSSVIDALRTARHASAAGARATRLTITARGVADRIGAAQGHRRETVAARRLLQARAPRADDAGGAQRGGQDDPLAHAGGPERDRSRRA